MVKTILDYKAGIRYGSTDSTNLQRNDFPNYNSYRVEAILSPTRPHLHIFCKYQTEMYAYLLASIS